MTTAFLTGAALPSSSAATRPATCARRATVCMDSGPPPESRIKYPLKGRFEAPTISFWDVPGFEMMNKAGLVMEEVPLDREAAAAILAEYGPSAAKETGDFSLLFSSLPEDPSASNPVSCYYPMSRRYEVPTIEISEADESVVVAVGKIESVVPEGGGSDDDAPNGEGAFWKKAGAPSASGVVNRNYGKAIRNLAPVIEFGKGELSISLAMEGITGQPDAGQYADRYMTAPLIRIKAPKGDWDESAFIEVSSAEVQLPILNSV